MRSMHWQKPYYSRARSSSNLLLVDHAEDGTPAVRSSGRAQHCQLREFSGDVRSICLTCERVSGCGYDWTDERNFSNQPKYL